MRCEHLTKTINDQLKANDDMLINKMKLESSVAAYEQDLDEKYKELEISNNNLELKNEKM